MKSSSISVPSQTVDKDEDSSGVVGVNDGTGEGNVRPNIPILHDTGAFCVLL